jgi:hypothetical protein
MVGMRRPRFQFKLSTLLWITLAVACWFGVARHFPVEAAFITLAALALVFWGVCVNRLVSSLIRSSQEKDDGC